jgi:hypothetical protein
MKTKTIAFLLVAGGALAAATFTGKITDTMCGPQHTMAKGQADEACVRACVKGTSSQYALYDGQTVMRLNDQKAPAKFAGEKVKVTGTYDEKTKTIKVAAIEAAQ